MPDHWNHRLYLSDIADSSQAIFEYTQELSFEAFCQDRKTYSAVIRNSKSLGKPLAKSQPPLSRIISLLNGRIYKISETF